MRGISRPLALVSVLLLAAALVVVQAGAAAAYRPPVVTMAATPTAIAPGQVVTLEADVVDVNYPSASYPDAPASFQVFFCLLPVESCPAGSSNLVGVTTGVPTGGNSAHFTVRSSGRVDSTGATWAEFTPGQYQVAAWYQFQNPDVPTPFLSSAMSNPVRLTVAASAAPTITSTGLPAGTVGVPYSATLTGTGTPTPTWAADGLPTGLSVDAASGVISGTPQVTGSFTVTMTASNGVPPTASEQLSLDVAPPSTPPAITSAPPPSGTVGVAYQATFAATGAPAPTWQAAGLPPGLTLDPATGMISGTPTSAATFIVHVIASNGVGSNAFATYTIVIAPPSSVPVLVFMPSSVVFGVAKVGTTSAPVKVTLTNTGTADLRTTGFSLSPGFRAFLQPVNVDPRACSAAQITNQQVLPSGQSCNIMLMFAPDKTGPAAGALTITGSGGSLAGGSWSLPLSGTGTPS